MPLKAGDQVDRYTIVGRLGEGGQAMLFRATDRLNSKQVALKLVSTAGARAASLERARREGGLLATLRHPSLVRCERAFEDFERQVYGLELDLVHGASLSQAIEGGHLKSTARRWVLHHVANALAYLHENGLVHRDVKPDNVLIDETFWVDPADPGSVKLVDLGIAVVEGNPQPLTSTGAVIGTAPYLAPELIRPEAFGDPENPTVGRPSQDVFAFGVLATELLVKRHPTGLPINATFSQLGDAYEAGKLRGNFPAVFKGSPYANLLRGCLALHPGDRFPDATVVARALPAPPGVVEMGSEQPLSTPVPNTQSVKPKEPPEGDERPVVVPVRGYLVEGVLVGLSALVLLIYLVVRNGGEEVEAPRAVPSAPPMAPPSSTPSRAPQVPAPPKPERSTSTAPPPQRELPGLWDHRVTVGEYQGCTACRGGMKATTGTKDLPEQARLCPFATPKALTSGPMTCVSVKEAAAYCESVGARLPSFDELARPKKLRDRGPCTDEGRKDGGNFYEWTKDALGDLQRTFCHKDLHTTNPPLASNSDLGFRCFRE